MVFPHPSCLPRMLEFAPTSLPRPAILVTLLLCGCSASPSVESPPRPSEKPSIVIDSAQVESKTPGVPRVKGPPSSSGGALKEQKESSQPVFDMTRMSLNLVSPEPGTKYNVGDQIKIACELTTDLAIGMGTTVGYSILDRKEISYDTGWLAKSEDGASGGLTKYEGIATVQSLFKPGKYHIKIEAFHTENLAPRPGKSEPDSRTYKAVAKPVEIVINDPKKKPTR